MMLQRPEAHERAPSPLRRRLGGLFAAAAVTLCAATFGVAQEPAQEQEPKREEVRALREEVVHLRKLAQDLMDTMVKMREKQAAKEEHPAVATPIKASATNGATADAAPSDIDRFAKLLEQAMARRKATTAASPHDKGTTSDIDLVTRCIELRGEVDIKKLEVQNAERLFTQKVVGQQELEIARIKLRTVEQQYDALRSMVKHSLQRANAEYAQAKKLRAKDFISEQELANTEGRIQLLERALR